MLLAGLISTASKAKKSERTLAETRLEMEVISQCRSGGLEDYKPSRSNTSKMKLEGKLDVVEYSRLNVPESVHMGDPSGGYMLNDHDSYRGLEEVSRCSNKELAVTRELLEKIRSLKEYAVLGKRRSFNTCRVPREWPIIHSSMKNQGTIYRL